MAECSYCSATGIEPNIGGCCVKCGGSGRRKAGLDPDTPSRKRTIKCWHGWPVASCPAMHGGKCQSYWRDED